MDRFPDINRTESMVQYKIIDYTYTTAAELARAILEFVNVPYEDVRIEKEKAAAAENDTPFGTLPVLVLDGRVIAQHQSICRYLAREHGLGGKDNKEAALCDLVMDGLWHMFRKIRKAQMHDMSSEEKSKLMKSLIGEDVPKYLDGFESMLLQRSDEAHYVVGSEITWADIGLTLSLAALKFRHGMNLDSHPLLQDYLSKMMEIPQLAEFLAKKAAEETGH